MEQIEKPLAFAQRLYLLKETASSIAERGEFWMKEDEASMPYEHRLMQSPLAQRVVRDLVFWSWDAARMLGQYVGDCEAPAIKLLKELGDRSLGRPSGSGDLGSCASDHHSVGLNELKLAGQALVEIVDDIFGYLLFDLPRQGSGYDSSDITVHIRILDEKLENMLYWLGEILDDLGKVLPPRQMCLADKHTRTRRVI